MKKSLLLAALLAGTAFAANANEMSYTFVEAGYAKLKIDDSFLGDPEGDGGYLRGSFAIAPQVYLFGGYGEVSDDYGFESASIDATIDQTELGIGWHTPLGDNLDFTADIAYLRIEETLEVRGLGAGVDGKYSDDAKGGRAALGLRGTPSPRTEAWIKAGYIDGGDFQGDWIGTLGGQVKFNPTWGLVGDIEVVDDSTRYFVGVRASF